MALDLVSLGIRHQVMLEGLKLNRSASLFDTILDLSNALQARLRTVSYENLGDMRKADLTLLLLDLRKIAGKVFDFYLNSLIQWLQDYIDVDSDFWKAALSADLDTDAYREREADEKKNHIPFILPLFNKAPDGKAIYTFAKNNPMGANGMLPEAFMKGFGDLATGRIMQETAKAYANVETKDELLKALIGNGTKFGGPKKPGSGPSSLLDILARQGDAMQRTVIQHVAAAANMKTSAAAFAQYLWVSVLDERTTEICISRSGNVYTYGDGPEPPAHIGCRSSTVPFDGTGPISMPSFTVWANGQATEYMNAAFDGDAGSSYAGNVSQQDLDSFAANRSLIIA